MTSSARLGRHEVDFDDVGGEGPPILLTPGATGSAADLRARFDRFARVYRLIAWDPPGDGEDRVRDHAALALELLHHRGIERAILAGDGEGALVCLRAGLQAPDRVRGLVLLDVPAGDAAELDRIDELDIPTLVVQTESGGARPHGATRDLAAAIRDARGVHLLEGPAAAVDPTREADVDPLIREYLESLPA
ncbi:alpha/beta fold hydrolase [Egicoccus sp. AB-alg6-2]|uniref:alpha/beta fold hydrolase n=1 Tax=Egicoccus sp. AB-alg6-2 TaxID=3242692 RepID=UPI00359DA43B